MNRWLPPGGNGAAGQIGHYGIARYDSAPSSLFADSVFSGGASGGRGVVVPVHGSETGHGAMNLFVTGESSGIASSESSCRGCGVPVASPPHCDPSAVHPPATVEGGSGSGIPLFRNSSSPAWLLSRFTGDNNHASRGIVSRDAAAVMGTRGLSSQWSFSAQETLPQISEMGIIPDMGEGITGCNSSTDISGRVGQHNFLARSVSACSWDDANSIAFSAHPAKRVKGINDHVVDGLTDMDSQYGLARTAMEISNMDYLQMQQESTTCRVRAKRGCATHPRSIAERERRTRISKKLKKLQDVMPNTDKQTSTSEMLDLAVQHIKELQVEIERLKHEQGNCTCSMKKD